MQLLPAPESAEEKAFFELAERFRTEKDPEQVKRLGDELGRSVFGSQRDGSAV